MLYELPTSSQWCFDIQWCPRNPAVLSAAGFDGHIDIFSIMGGNSQAQSQRHADQVILKLLDSVLFQLVTEEDLLLLTRFDGLLDECK